MSAAHWAVVPPIGGAQCWQLMRRSLLADMRPCSEALHLSAAAAAVVAAVLPAAGLAVARADASAIAAV